MAKGPKVCPKCNQEYPKKIVKCPNCGNIDENRARQVYEIECRASCNPASGFVCKKCGTLYPSEMSKCPYCGTASDTGARPIIRKGAGGTFETPLTKLLGEKPHVIKPDSRTIIAAAKNAPVQMTKCKCCKSKISSKAEVCPHCGNPTGVHLCPRCTSTNTKVISGTSKATSVFLWGAFAANKVVSKYECKDCGHKF